MCAKSIPLKRALNTVDVWITGQRKDQSPGTRTSVPVVRKDPTFGTGKLIKFNPLANWTSKQVWDYIRENSVPYNKLHEKGFVSIGCEPCTRPVLPRQHEREGRWWWAPRGCGCDIEVWEAVCGIGLLQPPIRMLRAPCIKVRLSRANILETLKAIKRIFRERLIVW